MFYKILDLPDSTYAENGNTKANNTLPSGCNADFICSSNANGVSQRSNRLRHDITSYFSSFLYHSFISTILKIYNG